eukprot:scaffold284828_cov18-Tisochrysis_lutea.AAC.1
MASVRLTTMLQNQCACVCVSRRGIMLAGKGDDGLIYFKVGGVSTSGVKVEIASMYKAVWLKLEVTMATF